MKTFVQFQYLFLKAIQQIKIKFFIEIYILFGYIKNNNKNTNRRITQNAKQQMPTNKIRKNKDSRKQLKLNSPDHVEEVDLLGINEQKDIVVNEKSIKMAKASKVSHMTESSGPPQPEKLPNDLSVNLLQPSQQHTQTSTVKVITRTVLVLDDADNDLVSDQYKVKSFNSNQMNVEIKNIDLNKDIESAGVVQQQVKDVVKTLEYTLHKQNTLGNNKIDNQQGLDQDINKLNRASEMEASKQHDEESEITLNDITGVKTNDQVSNATGYTEQHQVSSSIVETSGRDALRDFSSKRKMRESKNENKNIDTMIETIRRRTARQEMNAVLNPKAVKVIELQDDSEAEKVAPGTSRSARSGKKVNNDDKSSEGQINENHLKFIQSYDENSIEPQSFVGITPDEALERTDSPPREVKPEKLIEDGKLPQAKDQINKSVKIKKTEDEQEDLEIMILDQDNTRKFQSTGERSSRTGSHQSGMSYDSSEAKKSSQQQEGQSRMSRKARKTRGSSKSPRAVPPQLEQVNIQYDEILKPVQAACLSPVSSSTLPQTTEPRADTTKTYSVIQKPQNEISRFRTDVHTPTKSPRTVQQFREKAPASREISPKQINVTKVNKDQNPAAFEIYPIEELAPQKRSQFKEMKNPLVEKPLPEWNAFQNPQLNKKRTDEDYKKELEARRKTRERQIASVLRRQRGNSKSETQAQLLKHLPERPTSDQQVPLTDRSEQEARKELNQFLNHAEEPDVKSDDMDDAPMETGEAELEEKPVSMRIKDRILSPEHHKKIQDLRKKYSMYRKQQEKRLASKSRSPRPNFNQPKEISSIKVDNLYKQTQNNIKAHDQRVKKNNFRPVDADPSKKGERTGSLSSLRSLESAGVTSVKTEGGLATARYGQLASRYATSDMKPGQLPPPRTLRKSVLAQEQFLKSSLINDNLSQKNEPTSSLQLTKAKSPQPIHTRIPSLNRITQNASRRKERAADDKDSKSAPKQFRSKFQQNLAQKQKSIKELKYALNRPDSAVKELPNKQVASIMLSPEKYVTSLLNSDPKKMMRDEKGLADLRSLSRSRPNKNRKQGNKPTYMLNTESKDAKLGIKKTNDDLVVPKDDGTADLSMIKEEMTMSYSVNKTAGGLNLSLKDNLQRAFDCYDKEVEVQMFNQLGSLNSNIPHQQVPSVMDIEGKEQILKTVEESVDQIYARAQQEVVIGPNGSSNYASLPSTRKKTSKLEEYALRKALNEQEPQRQKYKLRRVSKDYNAKLVKSTFQCLMKSHTSSIGMIILLFLEGFDPNGPSLDSFKLAMLNRTFMAIVKGLYNVDTLIGFGINHSRQRFIEMLQTEPVYDKYQSDKRYVRNLRAAWKNQVFGNSVFTPIYGAQTGIGGLKEKRLDNKPIVKRNALKQQIIETPIDMKNGGGYYVLRNVQTNQNTFLDIYILIEGGITNKTDMRRMQKWNTFSTQERKIVPYVKVPDAGYFKKSIAKHVLDNPIVKPKSPTRPDQIESRIDKLLKKSKQRINDDKKAREARKFNSLAETPQLWTKGLRSDCMSPSQAFSPRANNGKVTAESAQKPIGTLSPRLLQDKRPTKRKIKSPLNAKDKNLFDKELQFSIPKEDIKLWLNGYARIIEFGTNFVDKSGQSNPTVDHEQNYVLSVAEGHFKLGQFSGYARCLDNEGECKVGFWKLDTASSNWEFPPSRPWGKFAHYYKDGSFKSPDGIYLGNDEEWNHLQKKKQINDYIKNERPVQSTKETKAQQKLKADELAKQRTLSPLAQKMKQNIKSGVKKVYKQVKEEEN